MLDDVLHIEETKGTVRKYRYRTTVPARIFKLLKLKDGDSLRWIAMKNGRILVEKKVCKVMRALRRHRDRFINPFLLCG